MTHYPMLGELLNRTPVELASAYNEAVETLAWLAICKSTPTRQQEYEDTQVLCSRIRFAFDARCAANGIEARGAKR